LNGKCEENEYLRRRVFEDAMLDNTDGMNVFD
jgi:hypothetical protein